MTAQGEIQNGAIPKAVVYRFLNLVCLLFTLPMAQTHDIGREVQSNSRTVYVLCVFEINTKRVFCLFCFVFVLVVKEYSDKN